MAKRLLLTLSVLAIFNVSFAQNLRFTTSLVKLRQMKMRYDSLLVDYLRTSQDRLFLGNFVISLQASMLAELEQHSEVPAEIKELPYIPLGAYDNEVPSFEIIDSLSNQWLYKTYIADDFLDAGTAWTRDSAINFLPDSVYMLRLGQLSSVIELPFNEKTRAYIERYTRRHSIITVQRLAGRAQFYFPIIEEILDAYDVPLELKYLPVIESALNPKAVSRAGATGLWQFMFGTGKMHNLEINKLVDERSDPIASTHAACRYLSNLYKTYGDWNLALAAYNCGPGNVNRAIKRSGGKKSYWEVSEYLPRETQAYVPAFVGAVYALNYYREHNIVPLDCGLPAVTDTVHIFGGDLYFNQISAVLGISVEMLRELNPQYKADVIPASQREYALRLPIEYTNRYIALEDSILAFKPVEEGVAQVDVEQSVKQVKEYYHQPRTFTKNGYLYYQVKSGDSFWAIAQRFDGVSTQDILRVNNMTASSRINPGQAIKIKRI